MTKRGKLVNIGGKNGRIIARASNFVIFVDRTGFSSFKDISNIRKSDSKRYFPSLRSLKKKSLKQIKYPHMATNSALYYYRIYCWVEYIMSVGESIRVKRKDYSDHNPKMRIRHEGVTVTYYNAYKPMLVRGDGWEFKIDLSGIGASIWITRGNDARITNDPSHIMWKLGQ